MASQANGRTVGGTLEVNGVYFCGHARPANYTAYRVDRRLTQNKTGKRRVMVAMRERGGRTLPTVFREVASLVTIATRVAPGSIVHADEASHGDALHACFLTKRINRSEACWTKWKGYWQCSGA